MRKALFHSGKVMVVMTVTTYQGIVENGQMGYSPGYFYLKKRRYMSSSPMVSQCKRVGLPVLGLPGLSKQQISKK